MPVVQEGQNLAPTPRRSAAPDCRPGRRRPLACLGSRSDSRRQTAPQPLHPVVLRTRRGTCSRAQSRAHQGHHREASDERRPRESKSRVPSQETRSSVDVVVVPVGLFTVVRRCRLEPPNPPQVFQNPADKSSPIPPTIIKMTPIVWMLKPVAVTETANRMIAPTAKITRLVPIPMVMSFLLDGSGHNKPRIRFTSSCQVEDLAGQGKFGRREQPKASVLLPATELALP